MYDEARTSNKSVCRETEDFRVNWMGVHQGLALSPYLFA